MDDFLLFHIVFDTPFQSRTFSFELERDDDRSISRDLLLTDMVCIPSVALISGSVVLREHHVCVSSNARFVIYAFTTYGNSTSTGM